MVVGQIAEAADFVVAGAGPGGYTAALHAARQGRKVLLVDRDGDAGVGGVCLNVGCIPSKALIEAADLAQRAGEAKAFGVRAKVDGVDMAAFQGWKAQVVGGLTDGVRGLLHRAEVEVVAGTLLLTKPDQAVVQTPDGQARFLDFKDLVLATGSRPAALADLPFDGKAVLDSTGALALETLPKTVAVIGGGYIGLELGTALAKCGSTVAIVEAEDRLLPTLDRALARPVARRLKELGVAVHLKARALGHAKGKLTVAVNGAEQSVPAQAVIVAVGRRPNSDALGLDSIGVAPGNDGLLAVAADRRLARHVAAIGDITPGPALAHKALAEAGAAVDALCGKPAAFEPAAIPAVVFSDPEVATAGLTAETAKDEGADVAVTTVPLGASGRAATLDAKHGFIQVVADKADGAVLGVHIVGPHASDLIAEGVLAIEMGATVEDLALTVHPHPTLSEQFAEAAHLALGQPLHAAGKPA
jgi:dihydrolipoamide dehydrogenase